MIASRRYTQEFKEFKNSKNGKEALNKLIRDEYCGEDIEYFSESKNKIEKVRIIEINDKLKDGEPCRHPGCLHHSSHPCEGCGRIKGIRMKEIKLQNPRIILISAFRYALGRATYLPSIIIDELIINWDCLSEFDKKQIQDDIRHAIAHNMCGWDCDIDGWKRILDLKI